MPGQSSPFRAGSPLPGMYGVPDTWEISVITVASANMFRTLTTVVMFAKNRFGHHFS